MSEYYLKYYELNKSKNDLIRQGRKIENLGTQCIQVRSMLFDQRGLGIDNIREKLEQISKKTTVVGNDLEDIGDFLETVLRETEAADHEAEKILQRFSLDAVRQFLKFLQKLLQNLNKFILGWVGGEAKAASDIGAKWASDLLGLANDEATQTDGLGALGKILGGISKLLVKGSMSDSGAAGAVKGGFNKAGFFASWVAGTVEDTFENFTDGEGTVGEDVRESVVEGLLQGVKAAGIVALTAGIVALVGATGGAAALVGVGVAIGVGWAMDLVSEQIFHNDLGLIENVGDIICDWFDQIAWG